MSSDLTTEILIQIRDELRTTRTELSSRIDATNERLDRVEKRQTESDVRLTTEIVALVGAVRQVRDLLKDDRGTRDAVQKHEERFVEVEQRLAAVEEQSHGHGEPESEVDRSAKPTARRR